MEKLKIICCSLLVLCMSAFAAPSIADEKPKESKTLEERQQKRADILRERAVERAQSQLGYPTIFPGQPSRSLDTLALSAQIARLSAMLNATAGCIAGIFPCQPYGYQSPLPPSLSGPSAPGTAPGAQPSVPLAWIYGPDGPTVESVRALLAYRLVLVGNPRLAVGEVRDEKDKVLAQVVTKDGSLVEAYSIDKQTGIWNMER